MADKPPSTGGGDVAFTAAVFVAALLPRLYVAIAWAREPIWDGHYYDVGARRIAAGFGYSDDVMGHWHPWCHYPVGYSGFLAILYRTFGDGPRVATVGNAVLGALLVVVVHRLARYATTAARARFAALLAAWMPGLVVYAALVMTEPLAALGMLVAAWAFVRDRRWHPVRGALIAGVVVGLTTLVRPQSLVAAPAIGLLAFLQVDARLCRGTGSAGAGPCPGTGSAGAGPCGTRLRAAAVAGGIALVTALAVVAPWTLRNCRVMDGCALVSTNGGWNLAIGSFPRATGRFEFLRATDGCPVVTGQVHQDRCWLREGMAWIRRDPWRWLALVPKKLGYTFDHESFPIGYLSNADRDFWTEARTTTGKTVLTLSHRLLLVTAALGVLPPARRPAARVVTAVLYAAILLLAVWGFAGDEHAFWPLAVTIPILAVLRARSTGRDGGVVAFVAFLVASVCLTHAVFFGEDRYHIVVTPGLCILAACALSRSPPASPSHPA